jgi:hypothetical protein
MRCVITQPNFLPWMGYLDKIRQADVFVLLDSVQHVKRSWQFRNRIISRNGQLSFLSVNTKKCTRNTLIRDIEISDMYNHDAIINKLNASYENLTTKLDGLNAMRRILKIQENEKNLSVANYIRNILETVCTEGLVSHNFIESTEIENGLTYRTASERLLEICKKMGVTEYLSSPGSYLYMKDELYKFEDAGIDVLWHAFDYQPYVSDRSFVPYLSFVDYLMHRPIESITEYLVSCGGFTYDAPN